MLLILAAVAISMAVDSNGLFARARKAAEDWNKSVGDESSAIENAMLIMNQISGGTDDGPTLPEGWDKAKIADVVEEGDRKTPIPKGYTASQVTGENTIEDGLVIYETTETITDEDVGDEKGEEDARRKYNQYVWIPVDDINSMVMCKNDTSHHINTETGICDACGDITPTPLVGKLYTGIEDGSTEPQLTFNANSGYREPAVVTGNFTGTGTEYDGAINESFGLGTAEVFLAHLQEEFSNMAKSVAKYKGFYISRYEIQAGAASKKGANVLNAGSSSGNTWYGLYTTIQNSSTPDSTVAQMIWGSQYDQVMMFVDSDEYDVQTAVSERHHTSGVEKSGQNDKDIACNIYDLEGNYYEWTAEAYNADGRGCRGRQLLQLFRIEPRL